MMMKFLLLLVAFIAAALAENHHYMAYQGSLDSNSGVTGTIVVFTIENGIIGYTGEVMGLEKSLTSEGCQTNEESCHVHLNSADTCAEVNASHYFIDPVTQDPWLDEKYVTDANGTTYLAGIVNIGTNQVSGKTFGIYDSNGDRVACAELAPVVHNLYAAQTMGDVVSGTVTLYAPSGTVYTVGKAMGLKSGIVGPPGSNDCTATNGCGTHIHSGNDCLNSTTQGGHLYNNQTLSQDPWALIGYSSTDSDGLAYFASTVYQDESDIDGRVFIIHEADGSRVACGNIELADTHQHDSGEDTSAASSMASVSFFLLALMSLGLVHKA